MWQLNRARRVWEEDRGGDLPVIEIAANWLERHPPQLDRVSALHGDYRSGNFLFDATTGRITCVLDWERGYLGNRHRDLAWTANRVFGCLAEDRRTFLASGLVPVERFFDDYQRASGLSVDEERLRYYTIFKDVLSEAWLVFLAPARTPADVVNRLAEAINQVTASAELGERFAKFGMVPITGTPAELTALIAADTLRWAPVIKAIGFKAEE